MRILILSPTLPYPPHSGFPTRVYQLLRLLGRRHDVSLLAYVDDDQPASIAALERACAAVHTVRRPTPSRHQKRWAQLSSMLSTESFARRYWFSAAMQQTLTDLCTRQPYDIVQVESSQFAGFHFDRRSALVLDEHDIVYELLDRIRSHERSPIRSWYNGIEFRKFQRAEIRTWQSVSACVTTSNREAEIIRGLAPATPTCVAPNGVDVEYFAPSRTPIDANAIVMTGYMRTRPNIDGAVYFIEHILPRVLAVRPDAVFYVVGDGAPRELTRLAGPHVVITGAVPDVRPYVERAAVFVVPLRMGGGTRLKVLEGLSMLKPMVSTSVGCEGIDVTHREHLLIGDEPDAFARAVLELLTNRALAQQLAGHGRLLVEHQYRWDTIADRLETFYEHLLGSDSRTTRPADSLTPCLA